MREIAFEDTPLGAGCHLRRIVQYGGGTDEGPFFSNKLVGILIIL